MRFFAVSGVFAALFSIVLPAHAVPLAPGGVVNTTGTTLAGDPTLGGVVLNDNLIAFAMDPTPLTPFTNVGGMVQNRVTRSNTTGDLIFGPRIRETYNIDGGRFMISAFRLEGFGSFATDVDFRTDGPGHTGFDTVSRSVSGDVMTFRYNNPMRVDAIAPGLQEESFFPSIATDATAYALTGRMTIYGYLFQVDGQGNPIPPTASDLVSVSIGGIAVPVDAVPVPATALLLIAGIAGFGALRRKR